MRNYLFLLFCFFLFSQCTIDASDPSGKDKKADYSGPTLFTELSPVQTNVSFENTITHSRDFNIFNYRNYYNGGGVGIGDINNDGLVDVYFTSNLGENKLYLNKGNLQFEDITKSSGTALPNKWSTGISMVDINQDGLLDIYVCNAGFKKGIDQKNVLFINKGNNQFEDEAEKYGLDENGYTTHSVFFDYDQDGDLDAYILNNSFIPVNTLNYSNKRALRAKDWPVEDFLKGGGDKLLKNENGRFVDVSEEAGILGSLIGFGLGITVGDVNHDHLPDLYVSNDFFERDYLYINQGNGKFKEELESRINHLSHSSMGADMADINNDGLPEIFVTDMLPDDDVRLKTTTTFDNINLRKLKEDNGFYNQFMQNTLQLNDGEGHFNEISFYANVAASDWSWGALMFDADNDGLNDLFVSNGIYHDVIDQDFIDFFANEIIQKMVLTGNKEKVDSIIQKMPSNPIINKFFRNQGGLTFEDLGGASGITKETFSNGAAYGDLDNDGDLDLIVNNVNQPAQIYQNNASQHYVSLALTYKKPNIRGLGAKFKVEADGKTFYRELFPSRGFQSSVDPKIVLGLGSIKTIEKASIIWPNGEEQDLSTLAIDQHHAIQYVPSKKAIQAKEQSASIFVERPNSFSKHIEDDYIDFYYERNIPVQLSKEGPCLAKGDFNGDGLEDLFIGAAPGQAPQLLVNTGKGFRQEQAGFFEKFKALEDTAAEFFDCDGDGDLDLAVGSGGNNATYSKRAFRDRLYINNNGIFEINLNSMPPLFFNTSVIKANDIDGDGDQDLFVGIRSIPGEYGVSPGSYILENNGKGQFLDVTEGLVPELKMAGMITDAIWVDILPQEGKELVLVGEWMSPKILSYDGKKMNIIPTELDNYAGWWQSVAAADTDNDGDQDLVLGNLGENFYLKASEKAPLLLWINDFDENGSYEKLITRRINGKDKPVIVKRDLADQIPALKKDNLMNADYAQKSIQELFDPEIFKKSVVKKINYMGSMIVENQGKGILAPKPLNPEAQLSCVNEILIKDLNNDGLKDLLLAGNNEYFLPQFSVLDACQGKVLLNEKANEFSVVNNKDSGLGLKGVVRAMTIIENGGEEYLLTLINNKEPKYYQLRK